MLIEQEVLCCALQQDRVAYALVCCRNLWNTPLLDTWAMLQQLAESGTLRVCRGDDQAPEWVDPAALSLAEVVHDYGLGIQPTPQTAPRLQELEAYAEPGVSWTHS